MLHAVNALVLGAVIHEGAVYVLHLRNRLDVENENQNAEHALQNRNQRLARDDSLQKPREEHGQQHKNTDRKEEGKGHDDTHHHLHCLFAEGLFEKGLKFRGLFLRSALVAARIDFGRPVQRPHTEYHRIRKAEDAPHKRQAQQRIPVRETHIALFVHRNAAVFPPHRAGIVLSVFHHDAFQNRLSADAGIFLSCHFVASSLKRKTGAE